MTTTMTPEELKAFTYSKIGLLRRIRKGYSNGKYFNFPSGIQIELTSFCNATCFFCAHSWSERKQQHIHPDWYKKIIDEVRSLPEPIAVLYLTGLGEPLMHPNWRELYYYSQGLPAAFTTNCSLLKEQDIDFLLDLDFQEIAFSLDTLNPERHKKIRGFGVDRVAPKIEQVFSKARKKGTKTRLIVSTTLTYDTLNDMQEIYDWLTPQMEGVEHALWHIKQIGHFPDIKAPIQIMPSMDFIKKLVPILPEHPKVVPITYDDALRPYCTLWFDRITILSDGSAVPCCHQAHDHHHIGNIRDMTLVEMFNSKNWTESQQKFSERDEPGGWNEIPYCKDCR